MPTNHSSPCTQLPPEVYRHIRAIQIRTGRVVTDLFAGAYHSAFKGQGMEFEDVREYQPGDAIGSIDWNVTARMDYPYVKNYREERELTVLLVVDLSASARFGSGDKVKRELIAEIGALLALSALRNNDKVGLLLFTDRVEKYISPKKGHRHILQLIRELLLLEPKGTGTDIDTALTYLGRIHKRRGVCFLLSDFIAPDASSQISLTARRHDLTAICLTDPHEMELPKIGLLTLRDLETGQQRMIDSSRRQTREALRRAAQSRITQIRQTLHRAGGTFVDLRTDREYVTALRSCFAQRERRRS